MNAPDDPLGFESRLADDQGWTLGYALAVVAEYRRFLVLTQLAGHPVSPSADVDEAWHLHLTRTAHYEAFCSTVFGRFLHHEPARAGEGERHRDLYRATLQAYRQAFGFSAPPVVWPRPGKPVQPRAKAPPTWLVPAPLRRGHRLWIVAVLLSLVLGRLLAELGIPAALEQVSSTTFLGAALVATGALGWLGLRGGVPSAGATARDQLEPYEAAWFCGGAERMAMTAIVALTERAILLAPGKPSERGARPPIPVNATVEQRCIHPAEAACLQAVTDGGLRFTGACHAMAPLAGQVERRLIVAGIASDVTALPRRRAFALLGVVVLLAIEFERLFMALGTSRRIGFLVLLAVVGACLALALAQRLRRANARAERLLRPLRRTIGRHRTTPTGQALAFGVALVGGAAMADDLRFDGLKQMVDVSAAPTLLRRGATRDAGDSSGCSSCSSCGSDGCSGGSDGGSGGGDGGSSCSSGCGGGGGTGD